MWFKNLIIYSFSEPLNISVDEWNQLLAAKPATDCTALQEETFGWIPPFKSGQLLCEKVNHFLFIAAQHQTKDIKPAAINERLYRKLDAIKEKEGRSIGRKERERIKEEIRADMMPQAFPVSRKILAFIDTQNQRLVINTGSATDADSFTAHLRESLGTLKVVPLWQQITDALHGYWIDPSQKPTNTEWLGELSFQMPQDSTVKARFNNLALEGITIQGCIDDGMRLVQASMEFDSLINFSLNSKWQFKRIKYRDKLIEQAQDSEDPRTDALLMAETITDLLAAFQASNGQMLDAA
ncbi:recombination-associated protein RdgC [Reinekea sp. G2M2-21]|uniref:recombination-associated protein RdgC n=1 Tax=Reinekea sp. G2M2-21 TaxID=2788942 RepID=UPI0018AC1131|nr:recombination-associated protein RdgC [Reinekea sp. G2M2-21]